MKEIGCVGTMVPPFLQSSSLEAQVVSWGLYPPRGPAPPPNPPLAGCED